MASLAKSLAPRSGTVESFPRAHMKTASTPHLSIVIPMFNREDLVRETISSIQHQEEKRWECIVVDDGSQDRSREVVRALAKADPRIELVQRPSDQPKGPSTCRNYGFSRTNGKWVWFVDSDDIVAKGAVENILGVGENESSDLLVGMYEYLEGNRESDVPNCWRFDPGNAYLDHVTKRCPVLPFMAIWRRDFLREKASPLWHPEVLFHAAYEFHARILMENPSIKLIDKVLYRYRLHDGSQSLSISKGAIDGTGLAQARLGKLDSRLRVLEGLCGRAETSVEKKALAHVKRALLVQIKRDSRHVQTQEVIARFRKLLLKERSLQGLLGYLLTPVALRTGRGFRLIAAPPTD